MTMTLRPPRRLARGLPMTTILALGACREAPPGASSDPDGGRPGAVDARVSADAGPALPRGRRAELVATVVGSRPATPGDVTGDGVGDLVVQRGDGLHVLAGPVTDASPSVAVITLDPNDDWAVWPTSFAGDVNGDGVADLILHAPWDGRLEVHFGPLLARRARADADLVIEAERGSFLGTAGWVGDYDGDGDVDLVVSAPGEPEEACHIENGGTLLFRGPLVGGPRAITSADVTIQDPDLGACYGWYMVVGELDGAAGNDLWWGSRDGLAHVYSGPLADGRYQASDATRTVGGPDARYRVAGVGVPGQHAIVTGWSASNGQGGLAVHDTTGQAPPYTIAAAAADLSGEVLLAIGEVDGDGHPDVVAAAGWGAPRVVLTGPLGQAGPTWTEADAELPARGPDAPPRVADLTGDDRDEVITDGSSADGNTRVAQVWRIVPAGP
jgi:hypothetical protein